MADPAPAAAAPAGSLLGGAPAAPAPAPVQGSADDARAWLPGEFREDPTFKDFRDVAGLAKSYKHAAAMVGLDKGQVLRMPKGADDAEGLAAVWNALGRPEKADGYGLAAPVDAVTPETITAFAAKAHALGLSKAQAEGVLAFYGETAGGLATQAGEAMAAQAKEAEAVLRKEFGAAFDDKIHAARRVLREVADEETIAMLDRTGLGNNAGLIKVLAHAAAASSEAPALKGGGDTQISRRLTPADAKAQLSAMEADEETMKRLMDGSHPGHDEAQARRRRLMADAYPGAAA